MGLKPFPMSISPKVDVIARQEFELVHSEVTVLHVNNYAGDLPQKEREKQWPENERLWKIREGNRKIIKKGIKEIKISEKKREILMTKKKKKKKWLKI